ncbi:diguanylate cyclase [Clostridium hydrogenum]|uniref:diguanylate cyclase n=1 Tax=Clostridium hydrogenum TaxID=2855764 RepID=UPI001F19D370|nr:diguanylate cyclase [Clostridium hydrogenum]
MRVIDNRYKIIKEIDSSLNFSFFEVADMLKENFKLILVIIDPNYFSKNMREYLKREFVNLTNLKQDNIHKVYNFRVLNVIDNKHIKELKWYYTYEFNDKEKKLRDFLYRLNEEMILDLFIEICIAVQYTHNIGYVYKNINLDNIYITCENNKLSVKINDILTCFIKNISNNENKDLSSFLFNNNSKEMIKHNIYNLGAVLFQLCSKRYLYEFNIQGEIEKIEDSLKNDEYYRKINDPFLIKMLPVIKKMILPKGYSKVSDIVKDLNKIFAKNYTCFDTAALNKLNYYTKIVGRKAEIQKVLEIYKDIKESNLKSNIFLIHGVSGIGKTRFLREIEYLIMFNDNNVYSSYSENNIGEKKRNVILEILKKIIIKTDAEIINKYDVNEILNLINKISLNKSENGISNVEEIFRFLNKCNRFINEISKIKPMVIIIDDFDEIDELSLQFIKYIYGRMNTNRNIVVFISYSDEKLYKNVQFKNFEESIINDCYEIQLKEFNYEETLEYINCIMGIGYDVKSFSKVIFNKTNGNPLFIMEVIKDLYNKKYIYFNGNEGIWFTTYEEIDDLPIHTSIFQVIENQVKDIKGIELELMNVIALFNIPLNIDIISKVFNNNDIDVIEKLIDKALNQGLLERIENQKGITFYVIANKMFKAILIDKIKGEEEKRLHETAANVLEKIDEKEYIDEILFHFEKSGNINKVIEYYLKKYSKPIYIKERGNAINNIKRIVNKEENNLLNLKGIKLIYILGELLIFEEKREEAKFYFLMCERLAFKIKEYKMQFEAIKKYVNIILEDFQLDEVDKYIRKQEEILEIFHYPKGNLELELEKSLKYYASGELNKAENISKNILDKCGKDFSEEKGICYYILSNISIDRMKIDEALYYTKLCIKSRGFFNNISYVLDSMNNMSYIYGTLLNDNVNSKKYLVDMLEIVNKFGYYHYKLLSLSQIAALELNEAKYLEAYANFKDVTELAKKLNDETIEFYCYCKLSQVCVRIFKLDEASHYFEKATERIDNYNCKNNNSLVNIYYVAGVELYIKFGCIEKAKKFIESDSFSKRKVLLENFIYYFYEKNPNSKKKLMETIDSVNLSSSDIDELNSLAVIFYANEEEELFNCIYKRLSFSSIENDKIDVLNALANQGTKRFRYALNFLIKYNNKNDNLSCMIPYFLVGEYYYEKKDYIKSINYLFESVDRMIKNIIQIPNKYRINFFKMFNFNKYINIFIKVVNEYSNDEIVQPVNLEDDLSNQAIERFVENFNFKKLFYSDKYKKDIQEHYISHIPRNINDSINLIKNLSISSTKNINNLLRHLKYITLAKNIFLQIKENDNTVVFDTNKVYINSKDAIINKWVIDRVRIRKNFIFLKRSGLKHETAFKNNEKSIICIPIYNMQVSGTKTKNASNKDISGILYLDTDKILNNFNVEILNKCIELNGLLNLNIEKYKLKRNSSVDKLTGTLVRRYLDIRLEQTMRDAKEKNGEFSILMYDLDNFKGINDKFGHRTGDEVLKKVSEIVMNNIDDNCSCIRYGGEEFIVILQEKNEEDALKCAELIRSKVEEAKILGNKRSVTISIGIASYPKTAASKDDLIEKVDKALYVAKNNRKNQCVVWNENFRNNAKVTNKITGIITGSVVQNSRNVLVMVEFIEMLKENGDIESKIFNSLGRLIEYFEASYCSIILMKDGEISQTYTRKIFQTKWAKETNLNMKLIKEVYEKKSGICQIDWDNISIIDETTGMPDWDSVMIMPLINKGVTKGVLYFNVPTKQKEFNFEEFNFSSSISNIIAALL